MTRYTSLAYKRTHFDAGFDDDEPAEAPEAPTPKKQKVDILEAGAKKTGWGRGAWTARRNIKPLTRLSDESIKANAAKSEDRRQKRVNERQANTICFACRGKGHAAKDCPDANLALDNAQEKAPMGICYRHASPIACPQRAYCLRRCGSAKHSLKRCRKPENPDDPLPFATCFVCSGKGHLAGSCGKNAKGVYPNGGSCVLCGKTTHLARDCDLRTQRT